MLSATGWGGTVTDRTPPRVLAVTATTHGDIEVVIFSPFKGYFPVTECAQLAP